MKNGCLFQGSNSPLSPFPNGEIIAWNACEALCAPMVPFNFHRLPATLNPEFKRYKKLVKQHARLNLIELSHKVEEGLGKLYEYMRQVKQQRENLFFDSFPQQILATDHLKCYAVG